MDHRQLGVVPPLVPEPDVPVEGLVDFAADVVGAFVVLPVCASDPESLPPDDDPLVSVDPEPSAAEDPEPAEVSFVPDRLSVR